MLKPFCDRCGERCEASGASARNFADISKAQDGGPLGIQILPVYRGEVGAGSHICNECVPELLLLAAKTFTASGVVAKQALIQADAKNHIAMKKILERQLEMTTKREKAAELELLAASECIANAEQQKLLDAEENAKLQAQIGALTARIETITRIKAAANKQLEEDVKNDPDYIKSIERRERTRIGGK